MHYFEEHDGQSLCIHEIGCLRDILIERDFWSITTRTQPGQKYSITTKTSIRIVSKWIYS